MLVIRLQRVGKKKQPSYRVVLQEKSWKTGGKSIELLGFYNPRTKEQTFQADRIGFWVSRGAQLSPTVNNLLVEAGIISGPKKKASRTKPKKEQEGAAEATGTEKTAAAPPSGETASEDAKTQEDTAQDDASEGDKEASASDETDNKESADEKGDDTSSDDTEAPASHEQNEEQKKPDTQAQQAPPSEEEKPKPEKEQTS